jgi:hypothetical protein
MNEEGWSLRRALQTASEGGTLPVAAKGNFQVDMSLPHLVKGHPVREPVLERPLFLIDRRESCTLTGQQSHHCAQGEASPTNLQQVNAPSL